MAVGEVGDVVGVLEGELERERIVEGRAPLDVVLVVADRVRAPPPAEAVALRVRRRVHEWLHAAVEERVRLDVVEYVELVHDARQHPAHREVEPLRVAARVHVGAQYEVILLRRDLVRGRVRLRGSETCTARLGLGLGLGLGLTCTARRKLPDSKRDSKSSPSSSPSCGEKACARAPPAAAMTAASALDPPDLTGAAPMASIAGGPLAFRGEPRPLCAPSSAAPNPDTLKGSVDGDGDVSSIGAGAPGGGGARCPPGAEPSGGALPAAAIFAAFSRRCRSLANAVDAAVGGWRRYRQSSCTKGLLATSKGSWQSYTTRFCDSAGFCSLSASAAMHAATSAWMSAFTRSGSGSDGSTSMCRGGGYRIACSLPSFGGTSRGSPSTSLNAKSSRGGGSFAAAGAAATDSSARARAPSSSESESRPSSEEEEPLCSSSAAPSPSSGASSSTPHELLSSAVAGREAGFELSCTTSSSCCSGALPTASASRSSGWCSSRARRSLSRVATIFACTMLHWSFRLNRAGGLGSMLRGPESANNYFQAGGGNERAVLPH